MEPGETRQPGQGHSAGEPQGKDGDPGLSGPWAHSLTPLLTQVPYPLCGPWLLPQDAAFSRPLVLSEPCFLGL